MLSPPVQPVVRFVSSPTNLAGPIDMSTSDAHPSRSVTRASVAALADPYIVTAALDYRADSISEAVEQWTAVTEHTGRTEPYVPVYMALADRGSPLRVRMLEVYDDEEGFRKHVATEIVQRKIQEEERLRPSDPEVAFLRLVGGYLHKTKSSI
jgi:quinol monooxygenase YgiN